MSLVAIRDFEIVSGKKMKAKSIIVKKALQLMRERKQYEEVEYEKVIDPFELMLTCYEVLQKKEKRMGNNNNPTGKKS